MALSTVANAQDVDPAAAAAETEVGEVIVTATRRAQNVQDVPMSVTAVTGEQMEKFQLQNFEQIEEVTSGLSLDRVDRSTTVTLRGVSYDPDTSAAATVDTYINDVPLDPNYALTAIFDVGQIEVLRGPQGTLRGRPAPTGAITLTTRRPNLSEYGGTLSANYSDYENTNIEGAINIPLIRDVLAVRFAALYDDNTDNGVYNIVNNESSSRTTRGYRGSVLWQATDNLSFALTHNAIRDRARVYTAVEGPGGTFTEAATPGVDFYNVNAGPSAIGSITPQQRLSVSEGATIRPIDIDLTTFNTVYEMEGHRLSYTYGRVDAKNDNFVDTDGANNLPNFEQTQEVRTDDVSYSHELRFESTGERFMDYSLGLWYHSRKSTTTVSQPGFLAYGFYNPGPITETSTPNFASLVMADIVIPTDSTNKAIFGNVVFNLPARTHLSVGARFFEDTSDLVFTNTLSVQGFPFDVTTLENHDTDRAFVYNTSLRHDFTDSIMGYVSYGTSYRSGNLVVGLVTDDPNVLFYDSEDSATTEIGFKTDWYDGRVKANVAFFDQKFDNYIGRAEGIPYAGSGGVLQNAGGFTFNGDAVARGVEVELSAQATDNLSFRVNWATADAHYKNAAIPCRDSNNDGVADNDPLPPGYLPPNNQTIATCQSSGNLSNQPNWTLNLQSEYRAPMTFIGQPDLQGYIRGLFNYRSQTNTETYVRPGSGILSIYAGVQSDDGWEFGAYVRNALDNEEVTTDPNSPIDVVEIASPAPGVNTTRFSSGYRGVNYTRGREIGASFRYRFGRG
jgi:iron complex outermembrane recepter protein